MYVSKEKSTAVRFLFADIIAAVICYFIGINVMQDDKGYVFNIVYRILIVIGCYLLVRFSFVVCEYINKTMIFVIRCILCGLTIFKCVCVISDWLPSVPAMGCYLYLALAICIFIVKIYSSPRIYRSYYFTAVNSLIVILLFRIMSVILFRELSFDICVPAYAIEALVLLFITTDSGKSNIFGWEGLQFLDFVGKGIVLFDYRDSVITVNKDAEFLHFSKTQDYKFSQFLKDNKMTEFVNEDSGDLFFWWKNTEGNGKSYRVEYSVLKDTDNRLVGKMFILNEDNSSKDRLTGFMSQMEFVSFIEDKKSITSYPSSIAVLDINKLSQINENMGNESGDQAIISMANAMKRYCPENSIFARMSDAILLVFCDGVGAEELSKAVVNIKKEMASYKNFVISLDIQSSVYSINSNSQDPVNAVRNCISSMKAKKMMDHTSAHSSLLDSLSQIQTEVDPGLNAHIARTRTFAEILGRRLNLSDKNKGELQLLCLVHDIGLIGVPLNVINKPGRLTASEWAIVVSHVEKGYRIASASQELSGIAPYILHHHENWNGSGYPDGLSQESIPLLSRIIAVLDTYDAMTNDRPYRKAIPPREARIELQKNAGIMFDPHIVREFITMLGEIAPIDPEQERNLHLIEDYDRSVPMGVGAVREKILDKDNIHKIIYSEYLLDENDYIIKTDGEFENLTGYSFEDVKELHLNQMNLIYPEEVEEYKARLQEIFSLDSEAYLNHKIRRKDGSFRYVSCYGKKFFDPISKKERSSVVVTDITDSYNNQKKLDRHRDKSLTDKKTISDNLRRDPITGLLNISGFVNEVEYMLLEDSIAPLLMIVRIEKYEEKCREIGEEKMNSILRLISSALKSSLPERSLPGKIKENEFGVLVPCNKSNVESNASYLSSEVWGMVMSYLDGEGYNLTVTLGTEWSKKEGLDFDTLYKAAVNMLIKEKNSSFGGYYSEEI